MSVLIEGMKLPQHAAVNGEKNTAYKCVILAHPDNSVELVLDDEGIAIITTDGYCFDSSICYHTQKEAEAALKEREG